MDQYPSITDSLGEDELRDIDRSTKKIAVEQLFRNGLRAILFNIINPVILALIFLSQTSHVYIYIWLCALSLLSVLRYAHILNRLPRLTTDKATRSFRAREVGSLPAANPGLDILRAWTAWSRVASEIFRERLKPDSFRPGWLSSAAPLST